MSTITAKPNGAQWRGVFLDGPQSDVDDEGEEIPVWVVYVGNDDGDPVGTVYRLHHFKSAELLAYRMAEDRDLELIYEAGTIKCLDILVGFGAHHYAASQSQECDSQCGAKARSRRIQCAQSADCRCNNNTPCSSPVCVACLRCER